MGRPKGDGARSKSRPSSSSQAASLSQGAGFTTGFGGYVGSTRIDAAPSDEAYLNVDGESAANLRRLSKKDPTTKLKALAALTAFFQGHSAAEVSPILPPWTFEYKRLVQDNSRQVREATHKAMSSLVSTIGRSLAPHLRSLMGAWWMAHFDPYYEVCDAASQALQVAFPGQKKTLEALTFCASDILVYIDENLKLTPQTISDKSTPIEESTEKYDRVVSSSLFALSALLNSLLKPTESRSDVKEKVISGAAKLFRDHNMFQGFLKSTNSRVRSAVYQAMKVYIQHLPQVFSNENLEMSAKVVLGTFSEKDPICHQPMWDMILLFSQRFGEAWEFSVIEKVVLRRFWAFLRHGCYGSQKVSYPCLLPLLTLVPPNAIPPAEKFFLDFFTNLWRGCDEGTWTRDDGLVLLNVMKECLLWAIAHGKRYSSTDKLQTFLIEAVLLKLLWRTYCHEDCLDLQKKSSLLRSEEFMKEVGTCIVDILISLDNGLLSEFWSLLRDDCLTLLRANRSQNSARMLHFFHIINTRTSVSNEDKRFQVVSLVLKPFVAEAFSYVKQEEQLEALKLLSGLISSFGPNIFELLASINWKGRRNVDDVKEELQDSLAAEELNVIFSLKHLEYFFRNDMLPWCVSGERKELKMQVLLAFFEDERFFKEWNYVLAFISNLQESARISVLGVLLKTLQSRCLSPDPDQYSRKSYRLERWRSSTIDEIVLAAASGGKLFKPSYYDLLRTTLEGALYEGTYSSILSTETLFRLLQEIFKAMVLAVISSKNEATVFLATVIAPWVHIEGQAADTILEEAKTAVDIFLSCYDSLRLVEKTEDILTAIFSSILCLYWTYAQPIEPGDDYDNGTEFDDTCMDVLDSNLQAAFVNSLLRAHQKLISLGEKFPNRRSLCEKLLTGAKKGLVEVREPDVYQAAAWWVLDLLRSICLTAEDKQEALDFLFISTGYWPFWSKSHEAGEQVLQVENHRKFSSMVHKIGCRLGPEALFLGDNSDATSDLKGKKSDKTTLRPWLAVELLCTWEWSGGTAEAFVLPFLKHCGRMQAESPYRVLLDNVIDALFVGASTDGSSVQQSYSSRSDIRDPYLRGLLALLRALFGHDGPLGRRESEKLFVDHLSSLDSSSPAISPTILPYILEVLMPSLTRGTFADGADLDSTICNWLKTTLSCPALRFCQSDTDNVYWMQVSVACFPLDAAGGATALLAASKADISVSQRNMLLFILRKQIYSMVDMKPDEELKASAQLLLGSLIAVAVAYCWKNFGYEEWNFILGRLRKWIEDGVIHAEEVTEAVTEVSFEDESREADEVLGTAVNILSLIQALSNMEEAATSDSVRNLGEAQWSSFESRAIENVLRIFLATGLAESLASTSEGTRQKISLHRLSQTCLWDRVADIALNASGRVREAAVRAADLWGLQKSAISALYALLFSPYPLASLQWVSYCFLAREPLQHQAVTSKPVASATEDDQAYMNFQIDTISDDIRPELLAVLTTPAPILLESDSSRGHYFLAWSIFLSHLQFLGTSSQSRGRLVQYVKESDVVTTLLDCLFQHIPLRKNVDKKEGVQSSPATEAAKRSTGTGTIFFAVEALLWTGESAVIAGALYGLLLRVLPACVQIWFTGLRDRGLASAIEAFTTEYCSPQLLTEEFNQVQAAAIADESLVIKANRSSRELTAVYKKEEAGMDIIIKMPSCYPLRPVEVDSTRRLGISETRLRKWLLSMAGFLRNQNGSLSEAVLIWKKNVDREFDGVEECPICYSIIHTTNHSLPRLACKTCKHKFHGACLYKWFSSSHKSTCPLCQTPF